MWIRETLDWLFSAAQTKDGILLMSYSMLFCGLIVFFSLLCGFKATYGRYTEESLLTKFAVPARVAWFLQELPSLTIPLFFLFSPALRTRDTVGIIVLCLFAAHYAQRTLIYPFLIKGGKPTPIHLFIMAFFFCVFNGVIQSLWHMNFAAYPADWLHRPHAWFGISMFLFGMFINIQSDSILRNLRAPGETGYKIPRGGFFEYVSGANFFGECLEWIGYAVFACTPPAVAFAVFTVCNIGPRAVQHHKWYLKKFEDYPKQRKAIIPFLI